MIYLRGWLLISFLFSSSWAWAAKSCAGNYSSDWYHLENVDQKLTSVQMTEIRDAILATEKVASLLESPRPISIRVLHRASFADIKGDVMTVPYQLVLVGRGGKIILRHPRHSRVIIMHELGHPYFDRALERAFPGKLPSREIQEPYSELFADLVAVLTTKGLNSVAKALHDPRNSEVIATNFRRFDNHSGLLHADLNDYVEPHVFFARARRYLGNNFIAAGTYINRPEILLKKTLDAIIEEIHNRMETPGLHEISVEEANRRLIAALDRHLAPEIIKPAQ